MTEVIKSKTSEELIDIKYDSDHRGIYLYVTKGSNSAKAIEAIKSIDFSLLNELNTSEIYFLVFSSTPYTTEETFQKLKEYFEQRDICFRPVNYSVSGLKASVGLDSVIMNRAQRIMKSMKEVLEAFEVDGGMTQSQAEKIVQVFNTQSHGSIKSPTPRGVV